MIVTSHERNCVSAKRHFGYLFNSLFYVVTKKASKLRITAGRFTNMG